MQKTILLAQTYLERRLELNYQPPDWLLLVTLLLMAAVLVAIVQLYRREQRAGSTLRGRMVLAGLRCSVVLLLVMIWFEPVWAEYVHHHIESYTLVLSDRSASMMLTGSPSTPTTDITSQPDVPTRVEQVQRLLSTPPTALLQQLSRRNRVQVWSIGDQSQLLNDIPARRNEADTTLAAAISEMATQPADITPAPVTDLGLALRGALAQAGNAPIAAVIVLSDGQFNHGENVEQLGRMARLRGLPVYTIGLGPLEPPLNWRMQNVSAPQSAFINDPFTITAEISSYGLENSSGSVQLLEQSVDGTAAAPHLIAQQSITAAADGQPRTVQFEHRPREAGRYLYQLQIVADPREAITADNLLPIRVQVLDNKLRVLLVAGGPNWTYRLLTNLLTRDPSFELSCWLQSADSTAIREGDYPLDHLPIEAAELGKYDLFLLLDPDPQQLPAGWAEHLAQLVARRGSGLLYHVGRPYTSRFFQSPTMMPLRELLPVIADPQAELLLNEIGYYQKTGQPLEILTAARAHPAMRVLQSSTDSAAADSADWLQVFWHYPVRSEKPAATVLLRHGHPRMRNRYGGHVLAATQFIGAGRSAFIGFDGTWRWRRAGEERFNQFWIQMLRYLAEGRLLGGNGRGRLQSDAPRYDLGQAVTLSAYLTDSEYQPLVTPRQAAEVQSTEQPELHTSLWLAADPARPGWYVGSYQPPAVGEYRVQLNYQASDDTSPITLTHWFETREPNLEIQQPQQNRTALEQLARLSAGGSYLTLDQAITLADKIPDRHESQVSRGVPEPLWDRYSMLLVIVLLLAIEWSLRKWWSML
ncbi:MAG: hypothetical protein HJJLKODD_01036 [Phycisphaerae bacterium]|nr:hypothetical protein [Phycisphaerae bacterium]